MKFPSLQTLEQSLSATVKRFPLTIIFMVIACVYLILINHSSYIINDPNYYYKNIIWAAYTGMLLSLVFTIYAERKKFSSIARFSGSVIILLLVIFYYLSLPDHFIEPRLKQLVLFQTGLHLLVAFAPFTSSGEVNGFWQYNKTLFLRALAAALYALVLFCGLALAILAIEKLFSVDIKSAWYEDLSVCIFAGFTTIFFLAGFPREYDKLESNTDYPKGLKIFTQYVLIPLITVYLVILYAYMFKIIGTRHWPYGWVSYLVLAFAIAGILSLLLIHPIRFEAQNKWMLVFSRFFYIAICPLIVLLFLAIERRISEYGITEERYFVLALSIWLAFIAGYFIFSRIRNIKIIPITLCVIALGISFGPWGVFSISFHSQQKRLIRFLKSNQMLSDDQHVIPAKASLHQGDAEQMKSIVEYLVRAHGYKSIQPLFSQNLDSLLKVQTGRYRYNTYMDAEKIKDYMNLNKYDNGETIKSSNYFTIYSMRDDSLMSLSGFEYLVDGYVVREYSGYDTLYDQYKPGGHTLYISFVKNTGVLSLKTESDQPAVFDLTALVRSLKKNDIQGDTNHFDPDKLILTAENSDLSAKCVFKEISVRVTNDSLRIEHISADILLHLKHGPDIQKR